MTYFDFMRVVNYKRNGNDYCPIAAARLLEEVKERDMKILENEKIKLGWVKEEKVEKVERVVKKLETLRKEIDEELVTSIKPLPKKEEGVVKVERKIEKIETSKTSKTENLSNGVNVKSIFPESIREMGNSMSTFAKKITERPNEKGIDKGEVKKQISYNLTSDDDKEDFVLVIDTDILIIFCAFLFIFLLIVI